MELGRYYLFDGFDEKDIVELSQISFEKTFLDGEIVFMEGESSKYLYILLDGKVEMFKSNAGFGELFLHAVEAPSMIAELPTFESMPFPASARASGRVRILKIEFEPFRNKMLSNPDVSYKFIKSLLQKIKILEGVIQKELNYGAKDKVLLLLKENPSIFKTKKQVEIAKMLNITPETLSRVLKKIRG